MRFSSKTPKSMSAAQAADDLRADRLVLVDVREADERADGFVPGSQHMPLGQLKQRLLELPADRPVAFICRSGRRSAMAANAARRAGLDARNVTGGIAAWKRSGLGMTRRPA